MPLNNDSLKLASLQSVFRAVVDDGCETRSEIAAATSLSIMTVGKAIDEFLDQGILIQKMKQKKSVGRQAGRVSIDPDRRFVVIDISKQNYNVYFFDLSLKCITSDEYEYLSDYSYSENLCIFLHRIKSKMLGEPNSRFSLVSMVVPGLYSSTSDSVILSSNEELEKLKVREFARSMAAMPLDLVIDSIAAASRYCAATSRGEPNILYISTAHGIDARLILKGKNLKRACSVGPLKIGKDGLERHICDMVAYLCNIVGLDEVVIESDELNMVSDSYDKLISMLTDKMPAGGKIPKLILNTKMKYYILGAALVSRNIWFDWLMK